MYKQGVERQNPWEREIHGEREQSDEQALTPDDLHYITNLSHKRPKFHRHPENVFLDMDTKLAVLKVSPYVVALISYSGEEELIQASGVIIETDDRRATVLTSANLLRHPSKEEVVENVLAHNVKVVVHVCDGRSYEGQVRAFDFHYNLAVIIFDSDSPLSAANLRLVDDFMNVNPTKLGMRVEKSFELRPHSNFFNIVPGVAVVGAGRYFAKPFDLMAAPGEFSLDRCDYDSANLFRTTCRITRCGEGGPLINLSGEVIGITFYDMGFTPFMPINLACKWWEHYKRYGEHRRPYLGMEATNLYVADIHIIEKVIQKFPDIRNGVIVEKVIPGSCAYFGGLLVNDVIIQCGGKTTQSFLELFDMIWDKVGDHLELVILRSDQASPVHLNIVFAEIFF